MFILDSSNYSKLGKELHENSPEGIRAVYIKMVVILEGIYSVSNECSFLQERFWSIFPLFKCIDCIPIHGKVRFGVGRFYLIEAEFLG